MSEYQPSYFERMKLIKLGLLPKEAVAKSKKPMKKVSDKRAAENKAAREKCGESELDKFFDVMIKRCTGKCLFCGGKTTAVSNNFWRDDNPKWSQEANDRKHEQTIETMKRASVAHLLPKRDIDKGGFPSVATNEYNWIELCWDCHTSFDKGRPSWVMLRDSKEWDIISEKLLSVLPMVAIEERKNKLYSQLIELVYPKNTSL